MRLLCLFMNSIFLKQRSEYEGRISDWNFRRVLFRSHALRRVLAHGAQRAIDGDHPYYVVTEFDAVDERAQEVALAAFEHALEQGWVSDGVIAQSEAQAAALWRLREGITESLAPRRPYKNDVSVRISAVPAFLHEMQALLDRKSTRLNSSH